MPATRVAKRDDFARCSDGMTASQYAMGDSVERRVPFEDVLVAIITSNPLPTSGRMRIRLKGCNRILFVRNILFCQ